MMNNNYLRKGIICNENCDACGIEKVKIKCEATGVFEVKCKKTDCFLKHKIALLHEQILGCKVFDEDAKPKVSLLFNDEFFTRQKLKELHQDHKSLLEVFFDEDHYKAAPLPDLKPVNRVRFISVENSEELQSMLQVLKKQKEIAVNLEYHSRRSYVGFTWLLQISTLEVYYLINCIKLQKELHILNSVFMELDVLKIFHNGEDAVVKLHKDFGIFVCNMFDTAILTKIILDSKEKEMLPKNILLEIGGIHTHMLIFLKTYLTNFSLGLQKKKFLKTMRLSCKKICESVDHTANFNKYNFKNIPTETVTARERFVIKGLLAWRDKVAQKEDESPNFIIPDEIIVKTARDLFNKDSVTLNNCYGAKFVYRRDTYLNIPDLISKAMRKSNKVKKSTLVLDDSTEETIETEESSKFRSENSGEKPHRSKSQKKSKQTKINEMKRIPKFF